LEGQIRVGLEKWSNEMLDWELMSEQSSKAVSQEVGLMRDAVPRFARHPFAVPR
jgi:hypothetical protein